jgi:threonine/homoserine/homoserine lactone efflux protein
MNIDFVVVSVVASVVAMIFGLAYLAYLAVKLINQDKSQD